MTSLLTNTVGDERPAEPGIDTEVFGRPTQGQISSGLRVANASDNAAYWSIATTMKSDTGALSAVTDALEPRLVDRR